MITKFAPRRYFWIVFLAFLIGCNPAQPNIPEIQTEAVVMAKTSIALTQTALPTTTPPPPTVTLTATVAAILTTPPPIRPSFVPIMTPDAFQVEHWREYQDALAKKFIFSDYVPFTLCEWDILGRAKQEVYVWAVCAAPGYQDMRFAVIHITLNGAVEKVEAPYNGDGWASDVQRMFPSDVQVKIASYDENHYITQAMLNHIEWRRTHPDELPLIVLSAMQTTPTP